MAALPGPRRDALLRDLHALPSDIAAGVSPPRAKRAAAAWRLWCQFCGDLHTDPGLSEFNDPVPILLLFAKQYRVGAIAPSGGPVRHRTPEDALRFVGQAFSSVGAVDPRKDARGRIDFRIQRLLAGWKRRDPPSQRRTIIPRSVLCSFEAAAWASSHPQHRALCDLMYLGLNFLLRPSEFLFTSTETYTPAFTLADVAFEINNRRIAARDLQPNQTPDRVLLHFTQQKNGISGEQIALHRTTQPRSCPVGAATRRVLHLNQHAAPPTTPLYVLYLHGQPHRLTAAMLTSTLRLHAAIHAPTVCVSTASLRATGATALLAAGTALHLIKLVGRWRSDEVFRYFHTCAHHTDPLSHDLMSHLV